MVSIVSGWSRLLASRSCPAALRLWTADAQSRDRLARRRLHRSAGRRRSLAAVGAVLAYSAEQPDARSRSADVIVSRPRAGDRRRRLRRKDDTCAEARPQSPNSTDDSAPLNVRQRRLPGRHRCERRTCRSGALSADPVAAFGALVRYHGVCSYRSRRSAWQTAAKPLVQESSVRYVGCRGVGRAFAGCNGLTTPIRSRDGHVRRLGRQSPPTCSRSVSPTPSAFMRRVSTGEQTAQACRSSGLRIASRSEERT